MTPPSLQPCSPATTFRQLFSAALSLSKLDTHSSQFFSHLDWRDPKSTGRYRAGQFQASAWHTAAMVGSLEDMHEHVADEVRHRGEQASLAPLVELKERHVCGEERAHPHGRVPSADERERRRTR